MSIVAGAVRLTSKPVPASAKPAEDKADEKKSEKKTQKKKG